MELGRSNSGFVKTLRGKTDISNYLAREPYPGPSGHQSKISRLSQTFCSGPLGCRNERICEGSGISDLANEENQLWSRWYHDGTSVQFMTVVGLNVSSRYNQ